MSKRYVEQLVEAWEEGYKKGFVTFWVLMALHDGPKHVQQVHHYIIAGDIATNITVDEKSLYRSMAKFAKMDLIDSERIASTSGGPANKVYHLTDTGREALQLFVQRNIVDVFMQEEFKKIIQEIQDE